MEVLGICLIIGGAVLLLIMLAGRGKR